MKNKWKPKKAQNGLKTKIGLDVDDVQIGRTSQYGWNSSPTRGAFNRTRLSKTVDPYAGFTTLGYLANGLSFLTNTNVDDEYADRNATSFWKRHLGFSRDEEVMPYTNVRFTGDYNKDGTPKYPNAEYVGLNKSIKQGILQDIKNVPVSGQWAPVTSRNRNTNVLNNYSVRNNNGSGIYDVYDTYDFNWYEPIPNRKKGYQMEIRDTIWGPNAKPELYDKNMSTKKIQDRNRKVLLQEIMKIVTRK